MGATYYVTKAGLDSNPGTEAQPWLTIQKGVNSSFPGDIVLVGAGTYTEDVTSAKHGTNNPIIFDGQNVASVYSFLTTHSNLQFRNFTVTDSTINRYFFMGKGAHGTVVSNCFFDGKYNSNMLYMVRWDNPTPVTETPFGGNCANYCLIVSNTFWRGSESAIVKMHGSNNVVFGNRFLDGDNVDWINPWGISNRFIGNFCSNLFLTGLAPDNHPDLFQSFGSSTNGDGSIGMLIESNQFIYGPAATLQVCILQSEDNPYLYGWTIRNNLFMDIANGGSIGFPQVHFLNNTFVRCGTGAALIYTTNAAGAGFTNYLLSAHDSSAINNVFLDCGGTNLDRGWYSFDQRLTNVTADYNYVGKNGYLSVVTNMAFERIGDAGGWEGFQWWEDHGINGGNPWLYTTNTTDARLQAISPLANAGTNIDFSTDMRGVSRVVDSYNTAPSIGAFEYLHPLTYLRTNPVPWCDYETRALMGVIVSAPNVITVAWPTNEYRNLVQLYRRTFTNDPTQWANWSSIHTNNSPNAGVFNDTNVTAGIHYEYQLRTGSTNLACGTNIDRGHYAFTYLNGGWQVPLRDQRGSVILLCEQGITNDLNTEITNLVANLRGDGYKVFRHDIAAVEVATNGSPGSWYTAVTNTKALIMADYASAPSNNWTIFIVGHVPIPYSGESTPGSHVDNVGAHPADWFYADTNAASWTDSTVNNSTSDWLDARNIPSDGKFDQSAPPTYPEMRIGRVDLRNMPAFTNEVELLRRYLNRSHQWRHKQFTVRDRALVDSLNVFPPFEAYGTYSQLFGNGTNVTTAPWLATAKDTNNSFLLASHHGSGGYTTDFYLGTAAYFAATNFYSCFNSIYGSYYGDWDSGFHTNDFMMAPLANNGYTLGLYYREQNVDMNPSSMGEPYADDLWFQAANEFPGSSSKYQQWGYWFTNGSTFINYSSVKNYTSFFGDPTLRIRQVAPPSSVVITPSGSDSIVTWTAASDLNIQGYHVYRAPSSDLNSFTRLTSSPTSSPYTDTGAAGTAYTYLVRTVKLEQSDARSYYLASQGAFGAQSGSGPAGTVPAVIGPGRTRLLILTQ